MGMGCVGVFWANIGGGRHCKEKKKPSSPVCSASRGKDDVQCCQNDTVSARFDRGRVALSPFSPYKYSLNRR